MAFKGHVVTHRPQSEVKGILSTFASRSVNDTCPHCTLADTSPTSSVSVTMMSRVMLSLWKTAHGRTHYLNTTTASGGGTLRFATGGVPSLAIDNDATATRLDGDEPIPMGEEELLEPQSGRDEDSSSRAC